MFQKTTYLALMLNLIPFSIIAMNNNPSGMLPQGVDPELQALEINASETPLPSARNVSPSLATGATPPSNNSPSLECLAGSAVKHPKRLKPSQRNIRIHSISSVAPESAHTKRESTSPEPVHMSTHVRQKSISPTSPRQAHARKKSVASRSRSRSPIQAEEIFYEDEDLYPPVEELSKMTAPSYSQSQYTIQNTIPSAVTTNPVPSALPQKQKTKKTTGCGCAIQ